MPSFSLASEDAFRATRTFDKESVVQNIETGEIVDNSQLIEKHLLSSVDEDQRDKVRANIVKASADYISATKATYIVVLEDDKDDESITVQQKTVVLQHLVSGEEIVVRIETLQPDDNNNEIEVVYENLPEELEPYI